MRKNTYVCMFAVALVALTGSAWAVPEFINYQGRVVVNGTNFNGTGFFKFVLINSNSTVTVWSNDGTSSGGSEPTTSKDVVVTKGLYSVQLGGPGTDPLPSTVFSNDNLRLRVWFDDGGGSQLMSPDQAHASVAYAMRAADSDALDGLAWSTGDPNTGIKDYVNQAISNALVAPSGTATVDDVLDGKTFFADGTFLAEVGVMTNVGQQIIQPGSTVKTINQGFHDGTGIVQTDPDLTGSSIRLGIQIFDVTGTLVPSGGTATPGDVASGKTFYGAGQTDWTLQVGTFGDINCAPGFLDLNGFPSDDCEFAVDANGIYVATPGNGGSDFAGCGNSPTSACATIGFGITRAQAAGRSTVHVSDGFYVESVTMVDGISLRGGYDPAIWVRNTDPSCTVIQGSTGGLHKKTIIAQNIATAGTTIDGFVVWGEDATSTGGNSYGIWATFAPDLVISDNTIWAGNGAPGALGTDGFGGANGADGGGASGVPDATYDSFTTTGTPCNAGNNRVLINGGFSICGAGDVSGGDGGGNICAPTFNTQTSAQNGQTGQSGAGGLGGGGGSGGSGGFDTAFDGSLCDTQTLAIARGANGVDGSDGANGSGGLGAANNSGFIAGSEWFGFSGGNGIDGGNGGGGGGAGGGAEAFAPLAKDILGAHGGGGGAGGCGGTSATGGNAGGGSIAIFIRNGSAPTITGNTIAMGRGGAGANGGYGGSGADGGAGGQGGSVPIFCSGTGGNGGDGGDGGHGGGAGGGAGGVSYGILTGNVSGSPSYGGLNTFTGGIAGPGGSGGLSPGLGGTSGVAGAMANEDHS
jgi:hypothetical protein